MKKIQALLDELMNHISLSSKIKNILLHIDRALFLPSSSKHLAYTIDAIYMGNGRWMPSPLTLLKTIQYLKLKPSDNVLEIGCGNGYQSAIFSQLCQRVVALDCDKKLLKKADKIFDDLKINNIQTKYIHKGKSWKIKEKFNTIIVSMAIEKVENDWFAQLSEGGKLIAPIIQKENYQLFTLFYKRDGKIEQKVLEQSLFTTRKDIIERCKTPSKYNIRFWFGFIKQVTIFKISLFDKRL
jgi:protein-L-isoaspartate(D-aspartate) O-methyltransferase